MYWPHCCTSYVYLNNFKHVWLNSVNFFWKKVYNCSLPPLISNTFSSLSYCFQRELGLLRQRSQSSHGRQKPLLSSKWNAIACCLYILYRNNVKSSKWRIYTFLFFLDQIFSYLIVIDFESTCWREKNAYSQEISKSVLCIAHCFSLLLLLPMTSIPEQQLFPLCSWVSCCSAEHINRGGWVRISYLCPTSGAPHPVRLLHGADRNHTGSEWEPV